MATNKQLGLYWGNNTLYFCEIISSKLTNAFQIPIDVTQSLQADDNKFITSTMQLVSQIEDQLKERKISTSTVNLSLPTKDIIFRSFVIPWMTALEVRGVVSFEISKYIPFSLEELWYSYHPITITVDNTKKLRIIFVAIRKDTLENYTNVIESAGLQTNLIEPCSQSILRTLIAQKLIDHNRTTAIIERGEHAGKITIVDEGIPQFVREFQIKSKSNKDTHDPKDNLGRLINETRISIDYFTRQINFRPVQEIRVLSSEPSDENLKDFGEELGLPTSTINLQNILPSPDVDNIAYLNAYGIGIYNTINIISKFDLSKKDNNKTRLISAGVPTQLSSITSIIPTLLICAGVALFTFFLTNHFTDKPKKNITKLETELGTYKDVLIEKIQAATDKNKTTFDYLKNIRTKSNFAFYLTILPTILPEGVWIKNLDLSFPDNNKITLTENDALEEESKEPIISLEGYAYSENIREQFKLVNQLLKNIREHPKLSAIFNQVTLETVKAEKSGETTITYYKIKCE